MEPTTYDEYGRPVLQRRRILGVDKPAPTPASSQPAVSPALRPGQPTVASVASTSPYAMPSRPLGAAPGFMPTGSAQAALPLAPNAPVTWDGNTVPNMTGMASRVAVPLTVGLSPTGTGTAADYLRRQAAAGTPLGNTYANATNANRENVIAQAGAQQLGAYSAAAGDLASGKTGSHVYAPVTRAYDAAGTAGDPQFQQAANAANSMRNTASGMNADISRLRGAADGAVPSAAAIQQQQGLGDAINQQAALAATARGGNLAASMRSAAAAGSGMQSRTLADAAALRANEMAAARGQLTGATTAQGQINAGAGALYNATGGQVAGRAQQTAAGMGNAASGVLGSQMAGATALGNSFNMQQDRAGNIVNTDRADEDALNNYLLQVANQGLGHGASTYGTDVNAGVQTRAQNLQLFGSAASGVSNGLAQFGSKY